MTEPAGDGIWRYARLFDDDGVPAQRARKHGWILGTEPTPLEDAPALAAELGLGRLRLKREDRNPGGSHKDRGVLYQVVRHRGDEPRTLVLSSSGNAAVSAAAACRMTGDRLVAFVAPGTDHGKRARLLASEAVVVETVKPINFARYAARVFGLQDLRGTRDPTASVGYRSLAGEIAEQAPEADVVATFSSSGISMEGLADGFAALGRAPRLIAVQSGECIGIVRILEPGITADPSSPAGRLGIRNPPHAAALAQRLVDSGGGAVAVPGPDVERWMAKLTDAAIDVAPEGGGVLAGLAAMPGLEGADVVAVITGAHRPPPELTDEHPEPVALGSYLEVRDYFVDVLSLEPA
ncbi:MAG: PLP-dependent lyase/thiolase [Proteobacteria bacterium]|nr:PLP-dependent lyase/thiolase [Pseudomonadota bacterium]